MGVDVARVDYHLNIMEHIPDMENIVEQYLIYQEFVPTFYLRYIDEYDRTIFNTKQIGPLVQELDLVLANSALSEPVRQWIEKVKQLAIQTKNSMGILAFLGD